MKKNANNQKLLGQFFTIANPFEIAPFRIWMESINISKDVVFLEPFAGANNIVSMIEKIGYKNKWDCFDIAPNNETNDTGFVIKKRDTLKSFPKGYSIAITNPPYLARNSATRSGLPFPDTKYPDVYLLALDKMISRVRYCAAIIPESFISSPIFADRLIFVASLTCKMFEDTECPVCLAMFSPKEDKAKFDLAPEDFVIYSMNEKIGRYSELKRAFDMGNALNIKWVFNDPKGSLGLRAVDNTRCASIRFVRGEEIPSSRIKVSSRSITRISGAPVDYDLDLFINLLNKNLAGYRDATHDVFLTSFKNLRVDNKYRRRLDFNTARILLNQTSLQMEKSMKA